MKVNELRERLKKYTRADLERLAVELYKAIPKAKKEDMAVDELIANPSSKKKKSTNKGVSLTTLREEVSQFIEHAEAHYYLAPNRVVPKGERSKWRFRVKRWYKDLQQEKHNDLVEFIFLTHAKLFEFEQGVAYYQQHHYERQPEVKLYILVRLLFNVQQPDLIVREINRAEEAGIKPRENLKQLRDHIVKEGNLPRFMR